MINFKIFHTQLFINFHSYMCEKVEYEKNQNLSYSNFQKNDSCFCVKIEYDKL
jgi:hypothetical protein